MCNAGSFARAAVFPGRPSRLHTCTRAVLLGLALIAGAGTSAAAQDAGAPATPPVDTVQRIVSGRVERPTAKVNVPVPGIWVTLHRVGSDTAGPIDSMRTRADGGYTFRYRRTGRGDAVYFVSASFDDIAYFSLPLLSPRVTGDSATITVFDTTSRPVPLSVRGRHLVIGAPDASGARSVIEVYEVTNDSSVTRISPDDAHPTWTAAIPAGATGFRVGQGDISARSVREDAGRVETVAPFAPGLKQVSFSYDLPGSTFPLRVPVRNATAVLEVLTEEPQARVEGAGLKRVADVEISGRPFTRYLAEDAAADGVISVSVPRAGLSQTERQWLIALAVFAALAMLVALAMTMRRARAPVVAPVPLTVAGAAPVPPAPIIEDEATRLAREIAALDATFERDPAPSTETRARYDERRAELKRALARALDARRSPA